ncbi:MAG TPA: acetyl-CoA carboxylase biotin carboxylase subunit [Gammaproteobacteria bacterium]|nr:acetyl-CoA carboxylase biotin carboxylase subunit [Gammaproteobacteria bacterium]
MFDKILIANRAEIACRIIRTCRRLGVRTVAVYSDADRRALHVAMADEARHIGGAAARESYLDMDRLIAAARESGAQAIHPGYGFLAQNAAFARRCAAAGLVFIGPRPESMEKMGSKEAAKQLMQEAGVPVVPGWFGQDQSLETLRREAERIGWPLMIKAVAGGGGKGMRRVDAPDDFVAALESARREAAAAFGDDRVLLEKYVARPRHIEVQVFGDAHGNVVHLFERECSLQRRYQKILEETPSPFLDEATRHAICEAAVRAARAVEYVNAGTVEFIVGERRDFYFMEMNTRLQVEHPVTEMVTGLDLVEWQLRVAAGEPLPLAQDAIRRRGHAVEVRICAENPERGFLPATGRIAHFVVPPADEAVRLDSGFTDGDTISPHYDSLLAKLIVHGRDRSQAFARMQQALAATALFGVITNLALLRALVRHSDVLAGDFDTQFLDRRLDELVRTHAAPTPVALAAAAARVRADLAAESRPGNDIHSPWRLRDGWRLGGSGGVRLHFDDRNGHRNTVRLGSSGGHDWIEIEGRRHTLVARRGEEYEWLLELDEKPYTVRVLRHLDQLHIEHEAVAFELVLVDPWAPQPRASDDAHPGAPMPGRVVALHVAEGDRVAPGQTLLVLEGMKMEYALKARVGGVVEKLHCSLGDMVEAETVLVDIAPEETK